ncbi:MAG: hypothetical protein HZB86_11520 [Deltaproteobacteria bacterium]|nr:hypothetical protein [Deltaproteobacteria bacterium]
MRRSREILLLSILAAVVVGGCSTSRGGTLAVQLTYPEPAAAPASAHATASRTPSYATHPSNRILIRVLAPHFAPIERWFDRSAGRGEIGGIPPGTRITVEVDEYDNTAVTLGTNAPLLGRGWFNGITLSAGETKTVPVPMYAKGTIVTVCGAPASGGAGTPGDTGDGGLDNEALLRNPAAVKVGPDDTIYVSTFTTSYGRVRAVDRYGYISHFAGSGAHGTITPGTAAASSPIDAVSDIDLDPSGNVYLFNYWNQIIRVDNGVVASVMYDNGVANPAARFDLAVVNVDLVYFVNYIDRRVYRLEGTSKSEYVADNQPYDTTEPISRLNYQLRAPSSIAYASVADSLVFADTDNDRIMRISLADGNIYYMVGYPGGSSFVDNLDASALTLIRPRVVDHNPISGKIFFVEGDSNRVLYTDSVNKVHLLAGAGGAGFFSGDGGPAAAARLNDPRAIAVDSRGNAYIADYGNHAVRMVVGGALP